MQQQYTTSYGKTHTIPTWVSSIAQLSRGEASAYIDSLTGSY